MASQMSQKKVLAAPIATVWEVLADFQNVSAWNPTFKNSYLTGDLEQGVGATRHCDLAPFGSTEETVGEWVPNKRMVINVDSASKVPFKDASMVFELREVDGGTEVTMTFDFVAKGGPMASVIGRRMEKRFPGQALKVLDGLEKAALEASAA